eukprot:317310-Chlamydomonas_euryale.AAC.1
MGALTWSLGRTLKSDRPCRVYLTSFNADGTPADVRGWKKGGMNDSSAGGRGEKRGGCQARGAFT